jgi:Tfp pilus assembly protein PilO
MTVLIVLLAVAVGIIAGYAFRGYIAHRLAAASQKAEAEASALKASAQAEAEKVAKAL